MHALVQPGAIESRGGRRAQADRRRGPPLHCRGVRRERGGRRSWCRPGWLCPALCLASGLGHAGPGWGRRLRHGVGGPGPPGGGGRVWCLGLVVIRQWCRGGGEQSLESSRLPRHGGLPSLLRWPPGRLPLQLARGKPR
jgi:hypothetical protein